MKKLILAAKLMVLSTVLAVAEAPPSGVYTNSFSGALALWDVSGTYSDELLGGSLDASYTMAMDGQGKITGNGSAYYWENGLSVDLDIDIAGSVKQVATVTQVLFTETLVGDVEYEGDLYRVNGAFKFNLSIDTAARWLTGSVGGRVCVSGQGCASIESLNGGEPVYFEAPIPDGAMDGSWNLVLTLQNVDASLALQGQVQLSNGRTLAMLGKGKYSSKTDQSKLALKGDALTAKGGKLSLVAIGPGLDVIVIKGKLLGQKPTMLAGE